MCIQQVDPCAEDFLDLLKRGEDPVKAGETEVEWPRIGAKRDFKPQKAHEVEPGESADLHFDVFGDAPINRVLVYTYFANASKRRRALLFKRGPIGWGYSTVHDLRIINVDQDVKPLTKSQ